MTEKNKRKMVEVFKGSAWEAELVKGLLTENGIAAMTKDGLMATIAPYIVADVTVMVSDENQEAAERIISEREKQES